MKYIILIFTILGMLFAAEIELIDGTVVSGEIIETKENSYIVKTSYIDDNIEIDKTKVINVSFPTRSQVIPSQKSKSTINPVAQTSIIQAGSDLRSFTRQYYAGFIMQVVGLFLMLTDDEDNKMAEVGYLTLVSGSLKK